LHGMLYVARCAACCMVCLHVAWCACMLHGVLACCMVCCMLHGVLACCMVCCMLHMVCCMLHGVLACCMVCCMVYVCGTRRGAKLSMQSFRHCWRPQRQRAARRMQHVAVRASLFTSAADKMCNDDLTANRPRTEGSGQCGTYAVSAQRWRLSSGQSIRAPSAVGPTAGEALPTHQRHRSRLRARAISAYACKYTMQHTHPTHARSIRTHAHTRYNMQDMQARRSVHQRCRLHGACCRLHVASWLLHVVWCCTVYGVGFMLPVVNRMLCVICCTLHVVS
jgi:hypothetical protein